MHGIALRATADRQNPAAPKLCAPEAVLTIRARRAEVRPQHLGDDEIGHVIDRESHLQAVGGDFPVIEDRAGVVDQDIDLRRPWPPGPPRPPSCRRGSVRSPSTQSWAAPGRPLETGRAVAMRLGRDRGDEHDPSALSGQGQSRHLADPGGGAGDDHGLALHERRSLLAGCRSYRTAPARRLCYP